MKYYQGNNHSRKKRNRGGPNRTVIWVGGLLVCLVGVFVFGVYQIRSSPTGDDTSETTQENESTEQQSEHVMSAGDATDIVGIPDIEGGDTADLNDVRGGGASGVAERGTKDGAFYHTVKANLPDIDREAYLYEGWLERRVPYDYFSTGEMVTNQDGEFVLEWEGDPSKDYSGYTEVIITLESRNGDPSPSEHVLEGTFRN